MYRIANSGILEWYFKDFTPRLFGGSEVNLDRFASSKLFLLYPREPGIRLGNVHNIFWLYFLLITIALIVLIYEILKERTMVKLIQTEQEQITITMERLRQKRRSVRCVKERKTFLRRIHNFIYRIFNRVIVV